MQLSVRSRWLAAVGIVLALPALGASEVTARVLDPFSVSSRSGEWTLRVNPSAPLGAGPCDCTMRRGGELAWEEQLPFTLWEAAVSDNGRTQKVKYHDAAVVLVVRHKKPAIGETARHPREPSTRKECPRFQVYGFEHRVHHHLVLGRCISKVRRCRTEPDIRHNRQHPQGSVVVLKCVEQPGVNWIGPDVSRSFHFTAEKECTARASTRR